MPPRFTTFFLLWLALVLGANAQLSTNGQGTVEIIGIPMVVQQENACALACAERLFRFHAATTTNTTNAAAKVFDPAAFAKDAGTHLERGTMPADMVSALRKHAPPLGLQVRLHHLDGAKELLGHITDYNRIASRTPGEAMFLEETPQSQFYRQAERPILKQLRLARVKEKAAFEKAVISSVDAGTPLIWVVMLNVAIEHPAPPIKETTGHVRLITGYNKAKRLIIYSDTWGRRKDARKALPVDTAWIISTGLVGLDVAPRVDHDENTKE